MARFPAQFIIAPLIEDLTTIITGLTTTLDDPDTVVINRQDQLNEAEIDIKELFEGEKSQVSTADTGRTKVGLEGMAKVSVIQQRITDLAAFFNRPLIAGATSEDPRLLVLSDDGGCPITYKTVIIRPYSCEDPTTNVERWLIFPYASIEMEFTPRFGLGTQFSYMVNINALPDPETGKNRVLIGDTGLVPAVA